MPHHFSYPDSAAENMAVLQYANADAGAEGIAELVLEAASAAVKVRGHAVAEAWCSAVDITAPRSWPFKGEDFAWWPNATTGLPPIVYPTPVVSCICKSSAH